MTALLYATLGVAATAAEDYEVFPFFSWFLFPVTPHEVQRYELRSSSPVSAIALSHPMDFEVVVQKLGRSVQAGDSERVGSLRLLLERNFLTFPCRYELVQTAYDPLKRWRGEPPSERWLAEFSCLPE